MKKLRFIIVGSGWRSLFFVRIAKAMTDKFEMCAMLCRTKEKADKMALENDIYTTTSIEECIAMKPDFVVVAVNKTSIADVSIEWMDYGFSVLCETPAGLDFGTLKMLKQKHLEGGKLMVAEQYMYYPSYQAVINTIEKGMIGEPSCINISLAHEYHGASLMREFLKEDVFTPFTISAKTYEFPTVETLTRYEHYRDGRVAMKKRTVATIEFADGKVAWYDFDSEQYRSPIRKNYLKIQGVSGLIKDNKVYYLDENYDGKTEEIYEDIDAAYKEGEIGIAALMEMAGNYNRENASVMLDKALWDSYVAILMQEAVNTKERISGDYGNY
ncbi:MAG: Gfo/Idh/MocA family oxidoreductase [Lachnospira sp.]|nr:Gfo/Idh/MocA family oxidoreductase [Lachnospira sp.]